MRKKRQRVFRERRLSAAEVARDEAVRRQVLAEFPPASSSDGAPEAELLRKICQGVLPEEEHRRYHLLRKKMQQGEIAADEHAELLRLSDEAELRNARRLKALAALARLRRKPLDELIDELGLRPCSDE